MQTPNPPVLYLTPQQAEAKCNEGAVIIDLRSDAATAYKQFNGPVVLCFKTTDITHIILLDKEKTYIIADTSTCEKSRVVAKELLANGFKNVFTLAGGFVEWERSGLPVNYNNKARLSGSCVCQLRLRG